MLKKQVAMNRWRFVIRVVGVTVCLMGAYLMWDGGVLGEETTGIARVLGIVGIGIIGTFNTTLRKAVRREA